MFPIVDDVFLADIAQGLEIVSGFGVADKEKV